MNGALLCPGHIDVLCLHVLATCMSCFYMSSLCGYAKLLNE